MGTPGEEDILEAQSRNPLSWNVGLLGCLLPGCILQ